MSRHDEFNRTGYKNWWQKVDRKDGTAGHFRLFGSQPPYGWVVYTYHEYPQGFANHRVWNFGLFAIHHVGEGKHTEAKGWGLTFGRFEFNFKFHKADIYRKRK